MATQEATKATTVDVETVRGWWLDLLNQARTRDEVHQLAAPWLEGTEVVEDQLAESALWDLHSANLTRAADGTVQHGGTGEPVHALDELSARYWAWSETVRMRAEDPAGWAALLLAQRREMKSYRDFFR